jgi:hypothetical protein
MDSTEQIMYEKGFRQLIFKSNPQNKYAIRLLPARQNAVAFAKASELLVPMLAAGFDTYKEYASEVQMAVKDGEDGIEPLIPSVSLFEPAVVFAQQIGRQEVQDLIEILLSSLTKNGQPVDLDDEFRGSFDDYMKIIEWAFRENLSVPFVRLLEEKGLSGMTTSLQQVVSVFQEGTRS